jgi:hypothetical protein
VYRLSNLSVEVLGGQRNEDWIYENEIAGVSGGELEIEIERKE